MARNRVLARRRADFGGDLPADVDVGAQPVRYASFGVAVGLASAEERMVFARGAAKRKNHFEGFAGRQRRLPALQNFTDGCGVVDSLPAPPLHLARGRAGELVPAPVVPKDLSSRVGEPAHDWKVFGQEPELAFVGRQGGQCSWHSPLFVRWICCNIYKKIDRAKTQHKKGLSRPEQAGASPWSRAAVLRC